jgi:hypothetical protein
LGGSIGDRNSDSDINCHTNRYAIPDRYTIANTDNKGNGRTHPYANNNSDKYNDAIADGDSIADTGNDSNGRTYQHPITYCHDAAGRHRLLYLSANFVEMNAPG